MYFLEPLRCFKLKIITFLFWGEASVWFITVWTAQTMQNLI